MRYILHEQREFDRYRARLLGSGLGCTGRGGLDRFVVDDFVIVTGGETISGCENFKKWIEGFLAEINACIWRSSSRFRTPTVAASRPAGC